MKKLILTVLLAGLLFPAVGEAGKPFFDGHKWQQLDEPQRLSYIFGFDDALRFAIVAVGAECYDGKIPNKANNKSYSEYTSHLKSSRYMPGNANYVQILNAINVLYKNNANRDISAVDIAYVVTRQLRGESQENTDKILRFLRGGGKDPFIIEGIEFP